MFRYFLGLPKYLRRISLKKITIVINNWDYIIFKYNDRYKIN